ncbi:helix-turn-helix domain-containing protein [Streptomyces sp. NPDC053792]|uniref:helix-turn-helix domain-containing protein n=1 Tax=Streptomyces sp. NPDC053792 TaxID=3365716 RepID=UPI0037D3E7E0
MLYTGARPFRLELGSSHRYFVLSLDAGTAGQPARADGAVTADAELPRSPSGRVLAAVLGEPAERATGFGPLARRDTGEHVSAILRTLLRETGGPGPVPGAGSAGGLERILAYVDERLAEDLSPGTITAAHHISVRHLHALFRESGVTVSDHVRRRRLERIRRDLVDPSLARLPAYVLAARRGLGEASHFSRVFRAEFGLSPRGAGAGAHPPRAATTARPAVRPAHQVAGATREESCRGTGHEVPKCGSGALARREYRAGSWRGPSWPVYRPRTSRPRGASPCVAGTGREAAAVAAPAASGRLTTPGRSRRARRSR